MEKINRFRGSLVGLAVGDAVGTTLEFKKPGTFKPIKRMMGGGPFKLKPGQWTDDTSMALCLAESLIECKGFDAKDQMERYWEWFKNGHLSSTGYCFDIGSTVQQALNQYVKTGDPLSGIEDVWSAGNGSIMRLAPVPLFYHNNLKQAIEMSAESSKTTHKVQESVDACAVLGALITGALNGLSKDELLSIDYVQNVQKLTGYQWTKTINDVALGTYKELYPPDIVGSGYVVKSIEAALWAFYRTSSFKEGLLLAVNLGDDADTTGAVYGQLAGAYYGIKEIPRMWVWKIDRIRLIVQYAKDLYDMSDYVFG